MHKELLNKLKKYSDKQEVWFDRHNQQTLELLCSDLRIIVWKLLMRVNNWQARRKQQEAIYVDTLKNDTTYKSDKKCKDKFELDNADKMMEFRLMRGTLLFLEQALIAYQNKAKAYTNNHIAYMHETNLINNK